MRQFDENHALHTDTYTFFTVESSDGRASHSNGIAERIHLPQDAKGVCDVWGREAEESEGQMYEGGDAAQGLGGKTGPKASAIQDIPGSRGVYMYS